MADRYWVGGTASWDGTAGTKWATTSGGTGGASVPTSADDVFFDAASGVVTCTMPGGNTAKSINCTGFTGTLTGEGIVTISGSITLVAGMTYTHSGNVTINGTGTLTTAGKTFSSLTIDGAGITVTLGDALNTSNREVLVTRGTFTTNNFNISCGSLNSNNTNTRTINLGSSTVTISGNTQGFYVIGAGLTFNAGTSQINLTSVTGVIIAGDLTLYNIAFTNTSSGGRGINANNCSCNNLSITAPASAGVAEMSLITNFTVNGTLSTTGTAGNRRVWFRSNQYGVRRTLTVNSAPSLTDADFRDIIVNGTAAPISGTRIGNRGACAGITFSAPKTVYWNRVGGGNWSTDSWASSSGGTASPDNFPLAQDIAIIENTGLNTSATVTLDNIFNYIPTVNMSTRTNAMTFTFGASAVCYGSFTAGSGITFSGANTLTFSGEGTKTITSAGKTFSCPINIDAYGGTVELADAFSCAGNNLRFVNGNFDTKNYNLTFFGLIADPGFRASIKFGSSVVTCTSNFNSFAMSGIPTVLSFDAGTSQINLTSETASFSGGNQTFYNVSFTATLAGTRTITGSNTFNNLSLTASATGLSQLSFASNQTVNGTLTVAGSSATQRAFVRSNTLGTTRTITANAISANDCDFRDITIAGSAAGASPTRAGDCGGNSGINFPAPKTVYRVGSGNTWLSSNSWALSSGGSGSDNNLPLAQDTIIIDDVPSTGLLSFGTTGFNIGTFDCSSRTTSITISHGTTFTIYGSYTLGSGVTVSGTVNQNFSGRGTQTFTSAGKTITFLIDVNSFSGTFQLGDAFNSSSTILHSTGTFDAGTYNVTAFRYNGGNSGTKTLKMGSGTWTLTGTGSIWDATLVSTFFKDTANIVLSDTSTSARTFFGGSQSYNKVTIGGTTGTSTLTIDGNNQFEELASTKTVAHTIDLGTTTQTFGKWTVTGSAGNVVTLTGTGVNHAIVGSATSGIDYLAMGSINFAGYGNGAAEFYAGANSTGTAGAPVFRTATPSPRTLYWVGGTGNWSSSARWSLSSGGAGGQPVPTSLDNVIFDSASNATAYTATIDTAFRCNQLTIAPPASGNITLAGTANLFIHGNVTLPATGLTRTYSGNITLSGSTTGKTFTTNGVTLASQLTVNGVGCGWSLGSALNIGSSQFNIINGSFDTGNFNLSCGNISSGNSNTRSIIFGSSTVSASGIGYSPNINLTFNAGTSQINLTSSTASVNTGVFSIPVTFYNVSFTNSSISGTPRSITGSNTFNNLSLITGTTGLVSLAINSNQTITGTFTCSGSSSTQRGFVLSDTIGTTRTLTVGTLAANDCDFRDITIAGTAAGTSPTRAGNCGGNSGITFPAPKTVYRVGSNSNWEGTNSWALTSGGAGSNNNYPLPQDTAVIDNNSGSGTLSLNASTIGSLDCSTRTTAYTINHNSGSVFYGNYTLGPGITVSGSSNTIFSGSGTQTITSAGKQITFSITIDKPTGSFTLGDAFIGIDFIGLSRGDINASSYNITFRELSASGSGVRSVTMGSGLWTITGTGNVWNFADSTNASLSKGTANLLFSNTTTSARTFTGAGFSYNKLTIGDTTGSSTFTINGNNTFTEIASTKTVAHTIALGTTTQRVGAFTVTGTAGNVVAITGNTSNLIYTGSGTITGLDYLNVQGRVFGPAGEITDVWYAGANSVNSGSLGWVFAAAPTPPAVNSNFFLMFA